jgi:uncharacterized protein (DUF697 family)
MKKSHKLLAKLGKSLDPERRPTSPRANRAPAPAPASPSAPAISTDVIKIVSIPAEAIARTAIPDNEWADRLAEAAETAAPDAGPASELIDHAAAAEGERQPGTPAPDGRQAAAEALIKRHVPYALGAGFVPLPLIDVAAISGVQMKLIAELSTLYGVPFAANQAKAIVAALLGGAGSLSLAAGLLGSLAKLVPGAGYVLGAGAVPLTAGALTYAVGHVFRAHFESGGTLLSFDAAAAKALFMAKVDEGRATLKSL